MTPSKEAQELKPCPWCGDEVSVDYANNIMIECQDCCVSMHRDFDETGDDLVNAWNTRHNSEREGWISVGERLPDDEQLVLAYREIYGDCILANLCISDGGSRSRWYYNGTEFFYGKDLITHWMPLPKLPKQGEQESDE